MITVNEAARASEAKDEYLVAVKLLLRKGDQLLVTKDQWGSWDIPGGRIRKDQFNESLESILRQKISVELGDDVEYEIGPIKATARIEREEIGRDGYRVRIFAVCYEGLYSGGEIVVGDYMEKYEWINIMNANLDDYSDGDSWVVHLKDYQEECRKQKDKK